MRNLITKLIAIIEIVGGALGFVLNVYLAFEIYPEVFQNNLPIGEISFITCIMLFGLAAYAFAFFSGLFLFKGHPRGYSMSLVTQALQIPQLLIAGVTYYFGVGMHFVIAYSNEVVSSNFFLGSSWEIKYSEAPLETFIGINVIALIFFIYLKVQSRHA